MDTEGLKRDIAAVRAGEMAVGELAKELKAIELPRQLPSKFGEVLAQIVDRMESSALFEGESCSFSSGELVDALEMWVGKAEERLKTLDPGSSPG